MIRSTLLLSVLSLPGCNRTCGFVFSDECVITEERCVEPQPIGCAISVNTTRVGGPLSLEEAQAKVAQFYNDPPSSMDFTCSPKFLSLCDDPNYFVYVNLWGDNPTSTIYAVEGSCSASFVDAYFASDPYHNTLGEAFGRAEPEGNVCFRREPLVYTGPPELEACAQKGRDWISTYIATPTPGTRYPPCVPLGLDTCDPDICYVDETQ